MSTEVAKHGGESRGNSVLAVSIDEKIGNEIASLNRVIFSKTPPTADERVKIEAEKKELIEFRKMLHENPNFIDDACNNDPMFKLYIDELNAELLQLEAERGMSELYEDGDSGANNQNESSESISKSQVVLQTIRDLNDLLKNSDKPLKQFFRLTGKKNERKQTLKRIKYKPRAGPAVYNVSAAEFQRFLLKHGIQPVSRSEKKSKMPTADEIAELRSLSELKRLERWASTPITDILHNTGPLEEAKEQQPVSLPARSMVPPLNLDPEALTANLDPLAEFKLANAQLPNDNTRRVTTPSTMVSPLKLVKPNTPLSPITMPVKSSSTGSLLSPINVNKIVDERDKNIRPVTAPNFSSRSTRETPRVGSSTGLKKSSSEARFDSKAQLSSSLSKMGISGNVGTSKLLFVKNKCMEMKTLRDQLMTTTGSVALNVHPEASPDNQQDQLQSLIMTKKLATECVERNQYDQTWNILSTPGYYEAVGPEKIFKSDCHTNHTTNAAFEKAVRDADVSNGISGDALTLWAENAVANKVKVFVSGGGIKV